MNLRTFLTKSLCRAALLCLFSLLIVLPASAQFSGPSLSVASTVNQTLTPTTDPAILFPANREIHLTSGDVLGIHLYGSVDYSPTARLSIDGSIELPLVGKLQVQGLTLSETERLIAEKLVKEGMYRNPQVTVQLTESPNQIVTVTGEIHQVVPVAGQRRLQDVLAAAGGLPPLASHTITIHRPGLDQPIIVDLGNDPLKSEMTNIPLFAGDTVVVSRAGSVYMLGAFKKVGAIPLESNSPVTLLQAATLAGGPNFEGKMNDLRLIRTYGNDRRVVKIDMKRVMNGKDPDPVLQTDDIVLLPTNILKAALKSGGLGTLVAFGSLTALVTQR